MSEAWVTLATNDSYAVGVLVLAHSLKAAKTTRPLVVMVTDQVSQAMREKLSEVTCLVHQVNVMDSEDTAHLALLARPELGITFTKLHCWTLTDFSKCVFLDADTLVIQNCDELFEREELSAAPDVGWPDCFNSGVFVFSPSLETYSKLLNFAVTEGSFDGGDQGLLNSYFSDWATKDINRRLPFIYNMTASAAYTYKPAYSKFGKDVRIVHFIGATKPWQVAHRANFQSSVASEHVDLWWDILSRHVMPHLSTSMLTFTSAPEEDGVGVAAQLAQLSIEEESAGAASAEPQTRREDVIAQHRQKWERGEIDYAGVDSFDNIMGKMLNTMSSHSKPQ